MIANGANLAGLLVATARRLPNAPGLIQGARRWTWAELNARIGAMAYALRDRCGLRRGDRLLVHAPNCPQMFEIAWACWRLGAVWVPSNVRGTPADLAYMAECSGARGLICDVGFPDHADIPAPELAFRLTIGGKGVSDLEALIAACHGRDVPLAAVGRDDPAWLFFTSGSTGRPKAAILTHGQLGFVITNMLADLMPGLSERDASLVIAPLSHGAGLHAFVQVARGAVSVLTEGAGFDPAEAWALIEQHRVSNLFTVPTILNRLVDHPDAAHRDHASLRHVIYAGAPMYLNDQRRALARLGSVLVQYYGLGEVTGCITVLRPEDHGLPEHEGTCGIARSGMQIEVQDPTGAPVATGQTGEICVAGGAVFAGYLDNPEANAEAFRNGWFRTGDLGHLDQRGYLYLTGRESDMYISGGSNIYPREIEEALLENPAIAEACVFGLPDPEWGESGVAVLVAAPGATPDLCAVATRLATQIARYKLPRTIVFWEALPRSGYGKVTKKDVRTEYLRRTGEAE
jgi:fatty-acyl-CoA synthase